MENGQYHGARALSRVRRMQGRVHRVQADSDALHACGCGETSERTRADGRSGWLNDRFCSVPPSAHTCWSRARGGHAPPARARAPLAAPRSYRRRRRRRDGRGQASVNDGACGRPSARRGRGHAPPPAAWSVSLTCPAIALCPHVTTPALSLHPATFRIRQQQLTWASGPLTKYPIQPTFVEQRYRPVPEADVTTLTIHQLLA
jgi:hypothetical protein